MENKYFTDYNKFTSNTLDAKTIQKKFINEFYLNEKIETLATKEEMTKLATKTKLKANQGKIIKFQTYDLSLFIGQSNLIMMEHNFI